MRVIGGRHGGRHLKSPRTFAIRPTPDRVREALFSILGAHVEGAAVLDLCCGTGALSIEALSRGAARAVLVDKTPAALKLTRDNLDITGLTAQARVIKGDAVKTARDLAAAGDAFDLVFADPPYASDVLARLAREVDWTRLVGPDARVVFEYDAHNAPPETPPGLAEIDTRRFGDTVLAIYERLA